MLKRFKPGSLPGWSDDTKRVRRKRRLQSDVEGDYYRHCRRIGEDVERNVFDTSDTESEAYDETKKPSNLYDCLLMGINWWNFLKAIRPKIPKTINPELRKELKQYDTTELQENFGARPTRYDLDAIE